MTMLDNENNLVTLLFNEYPLVIIPSLAELIGLPQAIILQQVHYWLRHNEKNRLNFYNDRYWTFSSYPEWRKRDFPFWSEITISRHFSSLEKGLIIKYDNKKINRKPLKLIISGNFNKKGYDRTKWYTIDYKELMRLYDNIYPEFSRLKEEKRVVNDRSYHQIGVMVTSNWGDGDIKLGSPIPENNKEIKKETKERTVSHSHTPFDNTKGVNKRNKSKGITKGAIEIERDRIYFETVETRQKLWFKKCIEGIKKGDAEFHQDLADARESDKIYDAFFVIGETIRVYKKSMHDKLHGTLSDLEKALKYVKRLVNAEIDPKAYTNWYLKKTQGRLNSGSKKFVGFTWPYFCAESFILEYCDEIENKKNKGNNRSKEKDNESILDKMRKARDRGYN